MIGEELEELATEFEKSMDARIEPLLAKIAAMEKRQAEQDVKLAAALDREAGIRREFDLVIKAMKIEVKPVFQVPPSSVTVQASEVKIPIENKITMPPMPEPPKKKPIRVKRTADGFEFHPVEEK